MNEQEILCFADIQAEEVKWLWYPYIPYGKITILQGDPGCGKTMAVLSLAALLSKGESLPFEEAAREPINILYQTSEDGIADTIKPRLESAGANCTRIKIINEEKRALTFDDPRLEQSILQENARLLILDPLSAYIGPTVSMNQANEVRGAFRSLYAMAQRTRCAVLIVAHMNKMSGISALYRTSGSIDIAGAVRSILTVTRYQRSPTQRVLVPVKSNLAAAGPALLFELSDHAVFKIHKTDAQHNAKQRYRQRGIARPEYGGQQTYEHDGESNNQNGARRHSRPIIQFFLLGITSSNVPFENGRVQLQGIIKFHLHG